MLSLTNHQGKPLGLHAVWPIQDPPPVSLDSIWDDRRYEAQARQRLGESERDLFRYFETSVPLDSEVAVVARVNDLLSPYFGSRLTREGTLVDPDGGLVPATAEWLVLSPHSRVRRCESAWQREVRLGTGFGVERRIAADACPL
jgi:hypothetical protein